MDDFNSTTPPADKKSELEVLKTRVNALAQFINELPGYVYWLDKQGNLLECNKNFAEMLGYGSSDNLIGISIEEFSEEMPVEGSGELSKKMLLAANEQIVEQEGLAANKSRAIYLTHLKPLTDGGVVSCSLNLTEQKKTEIASLKNVTSLDDKGNPTEIDLAQLIKSLPGNVAWKNRYGVYLGCTENLAKITGFNTPEEVIGKTVYDFLDKKLADSVTENDNRIMDQNEPEALEEEGFDVNGEPAFYMTRKVPLHDKHGKVIGLIGLSLDITERKKVEVLERENAELQSATKMLKLIAASMAHELRTPLGAISMAGAGLKVDIPMLIEAYGLAKKEGVKVPRIDPLSLRYLKNVLPNIENSAREAQALVDMLVIKSGLSGIDTTRFTQCSIAKCVEAALQRYPFKDGEKASVLWHSGDFSFHGDESLMIHILFNLFKNGLYYTKASSKGNIEIWVDCNGQFNELHFRDTGQGIADEILPNIFKHQFTTRPNGTGVGLAFCKLVMESQNGHIECYSKFGEYTEFVLSFPKE